VFLRGGVAGRAPARPCLGPFALGELEAVTNALNFSRV